MNYMCWHNGRPSIVKYEIIQFQGLKAINLTIEGSYVRCCDAEMPSSFGASEP